MRMLVAPDSFKGTFRSAQVAEAICAGLRQSGVETDSCPVADGGEGTAAALLARFGGTNLEATAHDPLGRELTTEIALLRDGVTAVVEVAAASGLPLVSAAELDAERATSYGTGELIACAVAAGARKVIVAAGGSATTDGGAGAITAIRRHGGLGAAALEILCDVTTPFEKAAQEFGPQKGADPAAVERLSKRLHALALELPKNPIGVPFTGCAGGLSGGLWSEFGARLRPGAPHLFRLLGLEVRVREAAAVVTGEGRLDRQSFNGKVIGSLAELCSQEERNLYAVVGDNSLPQGPPANSPLALVLEAETLAQIAAAGYSIGSRAQR